MKRTLFEVLREHLKTKPATKEEIAQLRMDLEREQLKTQIKELKSKSNKVGNILKLFTETEKIREPKF